MMIQAATCQAHKQPKMGGWKELNLDNIDAYQPALDFLSSHSNELDSGFSV